MSLPLRYIISIFPRIVLILLILFTYYIHIKIIADSPLAPKKIREAAVSLVKEPANYYSPKSFFLKKDRDLVATANFLKNNTPENSRIVFLNDQKAELGMLNYFVIYYFTDKKAKYNFDFHIPVNKKDAETEVANVKGNYVLSFKNKEPIYGKDLLDKTFLMKYNNGQLELVKIYD